MRSGKDGRPVVLGKNVLRLDLKERPERVSSVVERKVIPCRWEYNRYHSFLTPKQ